MMRLSTKGRYATRIMIALAMCDRSIPARKQEIADNEGISADYVEQILMRLKAGGLVQSHRGAKGGFSLAKDPELITVADVLSTTEGPLALAPCKRDDCNRATYCVAKEVWQEANQALEKVFSSVTIHALASRASEARDARSLSFVI